MERSLQQAFLSCTVVANPSRAALLCPGMAPDDTFLAPVAGKGTKRNFQLQPPPSHSYPHYLLKGKP